MAFNEINSIKVGNSPQGQFAGGFIYGANFTMGGVSSPSKLTLSVVDEGPHERKGNAKKYEGLQKTKRDKGILTGKKDAAGRDEDLSVRRGDEYKIQIGNIKKPKEGMSFEMSLIAYSEEKSPEQHTMTFEFVDTSHILDRVFIGLPNRHQKAHAREAKYYLKDLTALCPNCFTGVADRTVKASMIALRDAAASMASMNRSIANQREVNWQTNPTTIDASNSESIRAKGGIITLGREEFLDHGSSAFKPLWKTSTTEKIESQVGTSTVTYTTSIDGELPCDIPNVSYKFIDLLSAIRWGLGISIKGLKDSEGNDLNWEEKGLKDDYRQTYTGTLREVLNNWCADFGYGFVWDFPTGKENDVITFIDLKIGVRADFLAVKKIIEDRDLRKNTLPAEPVLVNQMSYSKSMEETYSSNYLSYYLKPHRAKTFNPFAYYQTNFYCLRVSDIFTPASCGISGEGQWNNFLISCALAKFDTSARKVHNALIGRWHAIGITLYKELTKGEKVEAFGLLDASDLGEVLEQYGADYNDPSDVGAYVATVNDDANSEWEQFEAAIADEFLGKHYIANPQGVYGKFDMAEFEACFPNLEYNQKIEMTPNANKLGKDQNGKISELPWASLVARSPAAMRGEKSQLALFMNKTWASHLYHFEIGAEWGTSQDDIDSLMEIAENAWDSTKNIETALPRYDSLGISGPLYNILDKSEHDFQNVFDGINEVMGNRTGMKKARKYETPQLLIWSRSYIKDTLKFDISSGGTAANPFAQTGRVEPVQASECSIRCETGLLETMCRCPTEAMMESQFVVGLQHVDAIEGILHYRGGSRSIIFPVNAGVGSIYGKGDLYKGFAKRSNEISAVLQGTKIVLGDDPKMNGRDSLAQNSEIHNLPENTMGIRVTAQDITNDAQMTSEGIGGENPSLRPLDAPAKLINVMVPDSRLSSGKQGGTQKSETWAGGEKMTDLESYHYSIKDHITSNNKEHLMPAETFSFSIIGTGYKIGKTGNKQLYEFLTPSKGMTSFNISLGAEGLTSSFSFSTRPSQLPKQETTMRKVGPTVWKSWYH